jgi:chromosome segregation ATPase
MAVLTATQQQTASLEHQLSCLNRELTLSRKPQQKQTPPTPDTEGLTKLVKLSQMDVERLQRLLSEERQKFSKLQEREVTVRSQLEEYQKSKAVLSKELTETKKKKQDYSSTEVVCRGNKFAEGVEALKCSGKELQTRNAMLRADLRATQEIQHSLERKISLLEQTFQGHSSSKYCNLCLTCASY